MKAQHRKMFARYLLAGSGLLFLAVLLGAFGAHGLEKNFTVKQIANWHVATNYMVIHAFALFVVAVLMQILPKQIKIWQKAGQSFLLGIVLFSGSLFAWSITLYKPLVFITPFGGTFFLVGWAIMFWGALKVNKK